MRRKLVSGSWSLLFILPAVIFVAVFLIYPFYSIFEMSFTNQTLVGRNAIDPEFVGLENYRELFDFENWMRRGEFGYSLRLTAQFVVGSALIGQAGLGLALAIAFRGRKGFVKEAVYTLVIASWIIPDVVVAFAWFAYLDPDGTLNKMMGYAGLEGRDWLFDYPMTSIILFNTWRGTAFSMLLFSSALASIPPSYLETADVMGANLFQKFKDITLPLLSGYILTDLILITLWTFNTFTPFLLTGGGPIRRSEVVSIYTYRVGLQFFEFGKGSAIAVVVMLINLLLASIYLVIARVRQARYA
jgi:multiple sugar transport system permease protein